MWYIDLKCYIGSIPSCPAEEIFLCRLLGMDSIQSNGNNGVVGCVEEALSSRRSSTMKINEEKTNLITEINMRMIN